MKDSETGHQGCHPPAKRETIIYLVESLMDPDNLGLRVYVRSDATLRALRQRYGVHDAIVPGEFEGIREHGVRAAHSNTHQSVQVIQKPG